MVGQQRIVIIGGGIIGLSTAYALLKQGKRGILLLEQAAIDHECGTSHGFSRLLRFEYGCDSLSTSMVQLSLEQWRRLEVAVEATLSSPTRLESLLSAG